MGHTSSRDRNNGRYRKSKHWKNQNTASNWADEDLGRKVSALLESNAHRRDAVILPTTSEIIQSYHASRRGSAAPSENNWVKLSFNGEKDHLNWLKDQQKMGSPMINSHGEDDVNRGLNYDHSSSVSPSHSIDNRWTNSKYPKPRPRVIMNWLRDLEILISDDESEDKEEKSPVFHNRAILPEEEPDQNIMVSSDIPSYNYSIPVSVPRDEQSNNGIKVDRQISDRSNGTKPDHGKLDLTTSSGIEPSYLMGAASSIKVLPTLPRKYRKDKSTDKSTDKEKSSEESSRSSSKNECDIRKSDSSTTTLSETTTPIISPSEEDDSYSPPWENTSGEEKKNNIFSRLRPKGLKSSSFTGFGQRDFRLSSTKYDSEYRKLKLRNDMNFQKALQSSITPSLREQRRRYARRRQHKPMFWSNQLNNFSLSSPTGSTKYSHPNKDLSRYEHYHLRSDRIKSRNGSSPPSSYGFDPYTDADLSSEQHRLFSELSRRERHPLDMTSGIYYHPYESDSETSLTSADDEMNETSLHYSRIWKRNKQMMSSQNNIHQRNSKPTYWHIPTRFKHSRSRYQVPISPENQTHEIRQRIEERKYAASNAHDMFIHRAQKHLPERIYKDVSRIDQHRNDTRYQSSQITPQRKPNLIRKSSANSTLNRRHLQHRLTTSSLSDIDPVLETKMNAMVRDMVYGSMEKRNPRSINGSASSRNLDFHERKTGSGDNNRAVGAIHERVASALATVLMSKSFPKSIPDDK